MPIPWQLAPWELDLWDAGDSNPRHLFLGRRCTVLSGWVLTLISIWWAVRLATHLCSLTNTMMHSIWHAELKIMSFFSKLKSAFSALQCRLECESGFVAQRTPLITCVNGEYAQGCHYLKTKFKFRGHSILEVLISQNIRFLKSYY